MGAAAAMSFFGLIHAYTITANGAEGDPGWSKMPAFTLSYAGGALFLLLCHWYASRRHSEPETATQ
jgi:AGZA family xanthine/uracil permease-like MFS transporter